MNRHTYQEKYRAEQTWRSGCSGQAQVRVDFTHVQFDVPKLSSKQPGAKHFNTMMTVVSIAASVIWFYLSHS